MKSRPGQGLQAEVDAPYKATGLCGESKSEKPSPAQIGPTVGLAFGVILLAELVALLIGHYHQADADTHGREDQDKYPAFNGLNHARACPSGLRVTEGAALAPSRQRKASEGKQQQI